MNTNTTATTSYNINTDYSGSRNILVPARMYSRNSMMSMMHIKSKRWLGVNLDRYVMTFHKNKDGTDKDPKEEIAFSHIKSVDADVSAADKQKYYLTVRTDDGDLKFKFKNVRDFHAVVEALRHTMHNDKPFYTANDTYNTSAANYKTSGLAATNNKLNRSSSSVSSDDAHDYQYEDKQRDMVRKDIKYGADATKEAIRDDHDAYKTGLKNSLDAREDIHDRNVDAVKYDMDRNDASYKLNKDMTKDEYKANKDAIKTEFKANKDALKNEKSHAEGDYAKDAIKADLEANKANYKAARDANENMYNASKDLTHNEYKANKDALNNVKDAHDRDYDQAKDAAKYNMDVANDQKDAAIRNVDLNKDAALRNNGY